MTRLTAILAALLCLSARAAADPCAEACAIPLAAPATISLSGTTITLGPSMLPGAAAEVTMDNRIFNSPGNNGAYSLTSEGITVSVQFIWDAEPGGADEMIVTPPEGYFASPPQILVPEGEAGTIRIYPMNTVTG